ncbi:MAG: Leucine-tRNA ligase [Microgenomates group bacterium GW2011_GWC1_46_16]|uniref:leucine--tRNA ligase n=2 Tax=Candidatus Collieribacteriota TaxID=1752725 RepID=A0A1F5F750_9BACT|nr:MAG: Leucine-tRNA ligase [Microgenomates group bacterium GW2011_GWF1_46_12]KKU26112.1 MAG: Leucine-tRNA ligase [Microgenomates group bacterium GW2011_GWC1_46_16]KKU28134.1 MAG: Leucine-tRNA ligase [Microgenomates group bacterium GW2011_GWF2_46_18]KKU60711.1 MAG: Leucine-tRNA ligase [Microgenomates group bacterium GW2011_GWD1_47_13]OGD70493.1 MAG: leucine--tRNA ligase [Candidatus Collierbacteria bacterium RIFOXYA1_FULL_46_24]OGD75446.1 MAG: leucine--tRNA ligase [Candidatus Collierbacteria ba
MTKTYVLGMFPYPSGEGLHVGHVRIYTAVDVISRYLRMKGREVLSPMGWDAFGLPAENAAIKAKKNPMEMVPTNYANFKRQMQDLSLSFDWQHELATTDPAYYGLTQWLFLELYKQGLVTHEEVPINWCPKCKTGLANEEVMADGTHERCGTVTGKKNLPQWVMKITDYAERLLTDLDNEQLDWPRGILEMQRNWIGKKEGAKVRFKILDDRFQIKELEVFTTRIDTINGVTFVVIAPELAKQWIKAGWKANSEVEEYVAVALAKSEQARLEEAKEKTGVATGIMAENPVNKEKVPVWVADYVLEGVGTGAVMGVPQYDERDLAFAQKYDLPVRDLPLDDYAQILERLAKEGVAKQETHYHLRDWVFSRQRYWGEPIPLVYCDKCGDENGVVALPETELPLTLPNLESYEPTDTGESPLSRVAEWVECKCPKCGGKARRETDTMPNWAGSCWYFLAFPFWVSENSEHSDNSENSDSQKIQKSTKRILEEYKSKSKTPYADFWREVAKPAIDKWGPVDWYLGGAEHAVLHLLYARFWVKVFLDRGLLDFAEPFLRLRSVGMVLATDGKKMSKSLGNVINPDNVAKKYGSDAVRLYEMFMGPWDQAISWDTRSLVGQQRFVERIVETAAKTGAKTSPKLLAELTKLAEKVTRGILEQKFNTAIAGMMELINLWKNNDLVMSQNDGQKFAQLLCPFAPQTAQKVWEMMKGEGQVEKSHWPEFAEGLVTEAVPVTMVVQVNGKLRATIEMSKQESAKQDEVLRQVMKEEKVKKWLTKGEPKRIVFVPGRLINLVS